MKGGCIADGSNICDGSDTVTSHGIYGSWDRRTDGEGK